MVSANNLTMKIRYSLERIEPAQFSLLTHPRRTVIDEAGNTFHIEFRGSLTTVTVTMPNGLRAKGNALLLDGDIYNKDFGESLATARATSRVLQKYSKWLASEGYRLGSIR